MPMHNPEPRHDPPWVSDKARQHTSELWLCVMAADLAVIVLAAGSTVVRDLAHWVHPALGAVMLTGAVTATVGLLWPGKVTSVGWTLEQSGWWLVASGWASYTVAMLDARPQSVAVWSLTLLLAASAATRALVVRGIERAGRAKAAAQGGEAASRGDDR